MSIELKVISDSVTYMYIAMFVKPQQWPTPSELIAIYCVRKLVSCVTHLQSCAKVGIKNKKKKLCTVAKIKTHNYKNWRLQKFSTIATLPLNTATTLFNEPRLQRPLGIFWLTKHTHRIWRGFCLRRSRGLQQTVTCSGKSLARQIS